MTHLWMRSPDGRLAAVAWAPCEIETTVSGAAVRVTVTTDYPFGDVIRIHVRSESTAGWPLDLRIPGWAAGAMLRVDDVDAPALVPGTFHRVTVGEGECRIELRLDMPVRSERRDRDGVALYTGPLLLAHGLGERWETVTARETVNDFAVYPTTPWNHALEPVAYSELPVVRHPLTPGRSPFAPDVAPVTVTVPARRLPEWEAAHAAAGPIPQGELTSAAPVEHLTLVPYGCTNLRIAEFPVLAGSAAGEQVKRDQAHGSKS